MFFKKRAILTISVVLILAIISGSLGGIRYLSTSGYLDDQKVILLDAGHGGFDGGAVASDGTVEKHINLIIAEKLRAMLRLNGYTVIMTRESDTATDTSGETIGSRKKSDLENRLKLMEEHPEAVFVSIHLNKFTTTAASGAQVFYTPNFKEAETLGKSIQKSVVELLQPDNVRVVKQGSKSTYLLKRASVPAVIVECGFLSNNDERERLKNDGYRSKMAFAIMCGINDFFKNEKD